MLTLVTVKDPASDSVADSRGTSRFAFLSESAPQARLDLADKETEVHAIIDFSRTGMALTGSTKCAVGDTGRLKLMTRSGTRNRYTDVGDFVVRRTWPDTDAGLAIELSEAEEAWQGSVPDA